MARLKLGMSVMGPALYYQDIPQGKAVKEALEATYSFDVPSDDFESVETKQLTLREASQLVMSEAARLVASA